MRHDSRRRFTRCRPTWLVFTLAALLAVPLLAVPAGAAPPKTAITDVKITGTVVAGATEGAESCLWRMEVTIENFHGGGKFFWASLGSSDYAHLYAPMTFVKGKVTSFVWEKTAALDYFSAVDNWAVRAENKKGPQALAIGTQTTIECGT